MAEQSDYSFKGVLKIRKLGDERYSFRLHPWTFSNDPSERNVCEIVFDTDEFDAKVIYKFEGHEVDVEFTDKTISIFDWDFGDEYKFLASSISQAMICYELSDLSLIHISEPTRPY